MLQNLGFGQAVIQNDLIISILLSKSFPQFKSSSSCYFSIKSLFSIIPGTKKLCKSYNMCCIYLSPLITSLTEHILCCFVVQYFFLILSFLFKSVYFCNNFGRKMIHFTSLSACPPPRIVSSLLQYIF